MKIKSKLLGVNLIGQLLFAVIFFFALYFSYNAITEKIYQTSLLERYADEGMDLYVMLHLAETGDSEGVKESLNLKIDSYIYEINQLLNDDPDKEVKRKAVSLLEKISNHRHQFPREARNILQNDVDTILEKMR